MTVVDVEVSNALTAVSCVELQQCLFERCCRLCCSKEGGGGCLLWSTIGKLVFFQGNDAVRLVLDCISGVNSPAFGFKALFWITEVSFNVTVFRNGA